MAREKKPAKAEDWSAIKVTLLNIMVIVTFFKMLPASVPLLRKYSLLDRCICTSFEMTLLFSESQFIRLTNDFLNIELNIRLQMEAE